MPKIDLEQKLGQFGLSEEESKVYLSLIKLGSSPVMNISHESNLGRSTTYYHLESLKVKGLVSESFTGKKNIYSPTKPKILKKILEQKEAELFEQKEKLPNLIDRIENIMNKESQDPEARILKGKIGLLEAMDDIVAASGDIYFIGSHDIVLKDEHLFSTEFFLRNFTAKRRQKGKSKAYIIGDESNITLRQKREEDTEFREIKIWPKLKDFNGGVVVFESKVLFFTVKDLATVYIIDNEITAELIKMMFKMIWEKLN